jgi:AraC-like DNA-binding protein
MAIMSAADSSEFTEPDSILDYKATTTDEATAMHERIYKSSAIRFEMHGDQPFIWRYRAVGNADLVLGTSATSAWRRGIIQPGNYQIFSWIGSGGRIVLAPHAGPPTTVTSTSISRYPESGQLRFEAQPAVEHFLQINPRYLRALLAASGMSVTSIDWDVQPSGTAQLLSTVRALAPQLSAVDLPPNERSATNAVLTWAVLGAYGIQAPIDHTGGRRTLRRAQEWMVANARKSMTNAEIAANIGVSTRAVEKSFQRYAEVSPQAFLRQYRMQNAHQELVLGSPLTTTVAAIARSWGLQHLGRFSKQYSKVYGELPSTTLRRSR